MHAYTQTYTYEDRSTVVYGVAEDGRELDVVAASRQARPHMYMYGYMTSSYVYVWVYDVLICICMGI